MMGIVITMLVDTENDSQRQRIVNRVMRAVELSTEELEVKDVQVIALPDLTRTHPNGPQPR